MNLRTLLCAAALAVPFAAQSAQVSLAAQNPVVTVGGQVRIDISVSGLVDAAAPSLGTFDFDLGFDAGALTFQSVTFGTGLDVLGLGSLQFVTPGAGTVNLLEVSLDTVDDLNSLQADSFLLATVTFLADAPGTPSFSLKANAFGDAAGAALDFGVTSLPRLAIQPGGTGQLPEPTTLALLALAAAGAAAVRRKSSAAPYPA